MATAFYRGEMDIRLLGRITSDGPADANFGPSWADVHVFSSNYDESLAFVSVGTEETEEGHEATFYATTDDLRALAHELAEIAARMDRARRTSQV